MGCNLCRPSVLGDDEEKKTRTYKPSRIPPFFEEAFQIDPELRSLVAACRHTTSRVFSTLPTDDDPDGLRSSSSKSLTEEANSVGLRSSSSFKSLPEDADDDGVGDDDGLRSPSFKSFPGSIDDDGLRYLSFESLPEATDGFADLGRGSLAAILELKDDIAGKPDLSFSVNDYFKNSADLLRFFTALCDRLGKARKSKTIVLDAFELFVAGDNAAAQSRLREFQAVEYPLDSNVMEELLSVRNKLSRMHDALVGKKEKLDKKLRSVRRWRKVCILVYRALYAATIISSVVLASISGPTGASTAAALATASGSSIGEWLKSRWDAYELGLEGQGDVVTKMARSSFSSVGMLRRVQRLVKRLDVAAESLLQATRDLEEKAAAAAVVEEEEEMENKLGAFTKSIDSVEEEVERCRVKLRRAMAAVVLMITKK